MLNAYDEIRRVARQVGRVPVGNAAHLATPNFIFWGVLFKLTPIDPSG